MPSRPIIEIIGDRGFHSAKPSISVRAVAHHLKEFNAGAVLVIDEESGSLLGICTERDLTFKPRASRCWPRGWMQTLPLSVKS